MSKNTDNKLQQDVFDWIMSEEEYTLESDSEGIESYANTKHKLWVNAHSSVLAASIAKSLDGQSVYAKIRAIVDNQEVFNIHNPQLGSKVAGTIYRISKRHFFGNGRIENTNYGVFVLTNETHSLLRVTVDKARSLFVTSDKQLTTIRENVLYYNVAPLRVILRGIRQFGTDHIKDNKANGTDECLNACMMAQIADNDGVAGIFPNMK